MTQERLNPWWIAAACGVLVLLVVGVIRVADAVHHPKPPTAYEMQRQVSDHCGVFDATQHVVGPVHTGHDRTTLVYEMDVMDNGDPTVADRAYVYVESNRIQGVECSNPGLSTVSNLNP